MKNKNWIVLDNEAIDNIREAVGSALTQGEMMLRASCARKWYYRYALRLDKRGFLDFNLVYGSLMHKLLETLYKGKAYAFPPDEVPINISEEIMRQLTEEDYLFKPNDYAELKLTKAKVQIAFDAYRRNYYQLDAKLMIKGVETTIDIEFHGLRLVGKLDMVAKPNAHDGIFIWDYKTAGHLDAMSLDAWTFRFQFLFYCWLYWKATGIKPTGTMVCGLVKSALRPKQTDRKTKQIETSEEYLFRIKGDMSANREKYFYRQRIPMVNGALERFEKEVLMPHLNAFAVLGQEFINADIINALALSMNTNQCHMYKSYCEYLSLCKDGQMAMGEFDRREAKHPEI